MSMRRASRAVLLAVCCAATVALIAGCGGSSGGGGTYSGAQQSPAQGTQQNPGVTGTTVSVTEKDFSIALSQNTFTPGTYTFVTENKGGVPHALEIEGNGEEQKTAVLQPGGASKLTVTLKKGTYELYCPVDGHKDKGMKREITVS